eukprot:scaffold14497_cov119-Cylindrotheca_fusiformis.AAC.12
MGASRWVGRWNTLALAKTILPVSTPKIQRGVGGWMDAPIGTHTIGNSRQMPIRWDDSRGGNWGTWTIKKQQQKEAAAAAHFLRYRNNGGIG